jgi:hypothetical protein
METKNRLSFRFICGGFDEVEFEFSNLKSFNQFLDDNPQFAKVVDYPISLSTSIIYPKLTASINFSINSKDQYLLYSFTSYKEFMVFLKDRFPNFLREMPVTSVNVGSR